MGGIRNPITLIDGIEGKFCNSCLEWHPRSEYYESESKWGWACKRRAKTSARKRELRMIADDLDNFLRLKKGYARNSRERLCRIDMKLSRMRIMLWAAKKRAKAKQLPFCITESDFPEWRENTHCPVFPWIEFNWYNAKQSYNSPTIDRINDNLGYVPGNVRIISWRANDLKRNADLREIKAICQDALIHLTRPK